ncbi:MAG: adenosine deaminase [Candidatus Nanopelagicales bacterium]
MTLAIIPTAEQVRRAPKAVLHDHLDGGLRPQTILELADGIGHALPAQNSAALATWFHRGAASGSLVQYLETFEHTVGVMQTAAALERVAAECAVDLASDGVVYAEVRFAPELHCERGLRMPEIVEAVLAGFERGSRQASAAGHPIHMAALLTAMRTADRAEEVAALTVRYRDAGVVGFDIAGAEKGFPPSTHKSAFDYLRRENAHFTIHAGEAYGLPSIWEAIQLCGAERLGHGVRIIDDITMRKDTPVLGRLASYVRDRRIPLELCPTSNLHTGAAPSLLEHPIGLLKDLHFRVTVNTDNRLMSDISMSSEMQGLVDTFKWTLADLQWVTVNAMKSAFTPFEERLRIINQVVKPGYTALVS